MWPDVAIIVAVISAIGSITAALIAYNTKRTVQGIHVQINSRMDELLRLTQTAAHAAGMQDQREKNGRSG